MKEQSSPGLGAWWFLRFSYGAFLCFPQRFSCCVAPTANPSDGQCLSSSWLFSSFLIPYPSANPMALRVEPLQPGRLPPRQANPFRGTHADILPGSRICRKPHYAPALLSEHQHLAWWKGRWVQTGSGPPSFQVQWLCLFVL